MSNGGYPAGADYDPHAPWNEKDKEPIEVEVTVTAIMEKKMVVTTYDYEADEEGCITGWGDLEEEVRDQIKIPDGWTLIEIEDVDC